MITDNFSIRHLGPGKNEEEQMIAAIGVPSTDVLINQTIPAAILLNEKMDYFN